MPDQEMIDRVAKAIQDKFSPAIDFRAPYAKVMLDAGAKAAIEAMREPTAYVLRTAYKGHDQTQGEWWVAMFDAILK